MISFPVYMDNIIFNLQKAGGISVYWQELIQKFYDNNYPLKLIEHGPSNNIFQGKLPDDIEKCHEKSILPIQAVRYMPSSNNLSLKGPGIFHSSYYRISKQKDLANIVTVYDFTYEFFRPYLPRLIHSYQKRYALRKADGIICISESTRRDMLKLFPELREKEIRVIYLGISEEFHPVSAGYQHDELEREIIDSKYVMFVGSRANYKNFNIAVDAVSELQGINFLIIGGGGMSPNEKSQLEDKLDNRYWHLDKICNKKLNYFYNHAFCLLYPSCYEGFGLPVVEAMKAGCPVVAVNTSSIPEAAGNAALLIDKPDPISFSHCIKQLWDEKIRIKVINNGLLNAKRFSWINCFSETENFYKKVFQYTFSNHKGC